MTKKRHFSVGIQARKAKIWIPYLLLLILQYQQLNKFFFIVLVD